MSKTGENICTKPNRYRVFHIFGQAKFADTGSILGSSQFIQLPQLPLKTTLDFKKRSKLT